MKRRSSLVTMCALLTFALIGSASTISLAGSQSRGKEATKPSVSTAKRKRAGIRRATSRSLPSSAVLQREMSAFRRPRDAADDLPAGLRDTLSRQLPFTVSPDTARRVGPSGANIWAVPAGDSFCAVVLDPPGTEGGSRGACSTVESVLQNGLIGITGYGDSTHVWVVATDGDRDFAVSTPAGSKRLVFAGNGGDVLIKGSVASLTWTDANGKQRVQELGF